MRKNIFFIIVTVILLWLFQTSTAFLWDDYSLDMYENIDEWIDDLENTLYTKNLSAARNGNILPVEEKLNELLKAKNFNGCEFNKPLDVAKIQDAWSGRISAIFEAVSEECKREGKDSLSLEEFMEIYQTVNELDAEVRRQSQLQSETMFEIARIGTYSDWLEENSPFDLIVDLQNIDKLIFAEEITYKWVNNETRSTATDSWVSTSLNSFWESFDISWLSDWVFLSVDTPTPTVSSGSTTDSENSGLSSLPSDWNLLVCQEPEVSSWLSADALASLDWSDESTVQAIPSSAFISEPINDDWEWDQSDENDSDSDNTTSSWIQYPQTNYTKTSDDELWPCDEFFCINVDFIAEKKRSSTTAQTKSIESIVENSNGHIGKFANSSLIQSTPTTNNFESPYKNLKLADIFHAGVQIQFIPPPILNLEPINQEADTWNVLWDDYNLENLLVERFAEIGIDSDQSNNLQNFLNTAEDRRCLTSVYELTLWEISEECNLSNTYKNWKTEIAKLVLDKQADLSW